MSARIESRCFRSKAPWYASGNVEMRLYQHYELLLRCARSLALREAIVSSVKPGCRVLDAGCGTGLLSIWAARAGAGEVVGVDQADLSLARRLAHENGCAHSIRWEEGDLTQLQASDLAGRFDLVLALLYFNDARRDERQVRLANDVCRRFLAKGGELVPDAVRYSVQVFHWPGADALARRRALSAEVRRLQDAYGVSLRAFEEELAHCVDPKMFPRRLASGELERGGQRPLGPRAPAFYLDLRTGTVDYPVEVVAPVVECGQAHAVVWTQELLWRDTTVFLNESISWMTAPLELTPGKRQVLLPLDAGFRSLNQIRARSL
jgi:SAM-dependent methyltransferase